MKQRQSYFKHIAYIRHINGAPHYEIRISNKAFNQKLLRCFILEQIFNTILHYAKFLV